MRTFEHVFLEDPSFNYIHLCCFAKTEIKSDFNVFFTVIVKNLVIIVHFCHR